MIRDPIFAVELLCMPVERTNTRSKSKRRITVVRGFRQ